ncbi:maltase A3-like [Copidosoma floridanum]|uniref:maltase A3-like n=1 Tax=Copidosoma floridanum TaxID=29053 RepID=UPI0006C9741C|nr:maltase A3-like [Copidosoma floridanum]
MPRVSRTLLLLSFLLLILDRISGAAVVTTSHPNDNDDNDDEEDEKEGGNRSTTEPSEQRDWRDNAHMYHVLPRSFQDSDADGEGDLQGIIGHLEYFRDIGVDVVRLGPIFSSPMRDSGYDVSNFTSIDEIYGDFDDFYQLVSELHKRGIKIILDIVPNHSSDQHEWFLESAADKEPYDDYYIWADGKVEDNKLVPPNNWKSAYSDKEGSAWSWNKQRRQWFYHKFHESEPDLNLRNEDVIKEILDTFDFWLERGVDGFCISGVSYIFENEEMLDESNEDDEDGDNDQDGNNDDDSYTTGESDNIALLQRFREHIDNWAREHDDEPKLLLGEVDEDDEQVISYYGNETHPGLTPLSLLLITDLNATNNAGDIKMLIDDWMDDLPRDAEPIWMLSNQDNSRVSSRLDNDTLDGMLMLTMLLPGQVMTYYGDEIGMTNGNVSWEETIDMRAIAQGEDDYEDNSRDPFRTPMQWDDTTSAGFSLNESTFLPVGSDYLEYNVDKQLLDPDSNLLAYKRLAELRENPIFVHGTYDLTVVNDDKVLILKRTYEGNTCLVVVNFGGAKETVNLTHLYDDLEKDLQVMVDSSNADVDNVNDEDDDDDIENDAFVLDANAAAVLCDKHNFDESDNTTLAYETTTEEEDDDVDSTSEPVTPTSTEEPSTVYGFPTEEPEPSSASITQIVQFIIIILTVVSCFL